VEQTAALLLKLSTLSDEEAVQLLATKKHKGAVAK
jgi:hypothetical protein